jgi:hypothetical protein
MLITTETLRQPEMQEALDLFYANKKVFVDESIREHFSISKLHSILHYIDSIIFFGTLDGFNSKHFKEGPGERLRIHYENKGYRASWPATGEIIQMTRWFQRQEAIALHISGGSISMLKIRVFWIPTQRNLMKKMTMERPNIVTRRLMQIPFTQNLYA